jgi:uncharacterized protein (UPF0335 family)
MSVLEKLKVLDAQRAELVEGAKQEALDKAEKAIADLNSLGFDYRLVEGTITVRVSRKAEHKHQSVKLATSLARYVSLKHYRRMTRGRIDRKHLSGPSLLNSLWKRALAR